jgi:hypothetical protein
MVSGKKIGATELMDSKLIDFGMAKSYIDPKTRRHKEQKIQN